MSPSPGLQCTQYTWGVPICLPRLHSGNPFPEKKEGQGFPECFLWLLPPFILWGARAVPGLDVAMGTSDLVHGERWWHRPQRSWARRLLPPTSCLWGQCGPGQLDARLRK